MDYEMFRDIVIVGLVIGVISVGSYTGMMNSEVDIHICKNNNITTYVGLRKPSELLNFGECETIRRKKRVYFELRHNMSNSAPRH